jgi:hypothetical protein
LLRHLLTQSPQQYAWATYTGMGHDSPSPNKSI